MLTNAQPIPSHLPVETVTATTYTVGGELGYILAAPASDATWTLPAVGDSTVVIGALLSIRNAGPGTITLTPAAGESVNGPATVAPGFTFNAVTDGTTAWKVLSVDVVNGGPPPAVITVNPNVAADGVTVFNTIQSAVDSLGNKSIQRTLINITPGTYEENVFYTSKLSSEDDSFSFDDTTMVFIGDSRPIVGCGIAYDCSWNRQGTPGPVGGGNNSRAVLNGTAGSPTLTVTASVGTNPNFIAAGVVAGDRVCIRHNQQGSPANQFAFYTIAPGGVAATTLTFTTNLLFNVNAIGSAMVVVPNVAIAPPDNGLDLFTPSGVLSISGVAFIAPSDFPYCINAQTNTTLFLLNCFFYYGWWQLSMFSTNIRGYHGSYGSTFFFAADRAVYGFGETMSDMPNCLICPTDGAAAIISENGARCSYGKLSAIGGNVASGQAFIWGIDGAFVSTGGGVCDVICTGGTAVGSNDGSQVLLSFNGDVRIRGYGAGGPTTALAAVQGSRITSSTTTNVTIDCANSGASFVAVQVGGDETAANTGISSAALVCLGLNLVATPASSTIATVSGGSELVVAGIASTAPGLNSNGFVVRAGSSLVWAANAGSTLAGGGGTGVLFDVAENSSLTFTNVASTRTFTGYGTIFSVDTGSRAYITQATCTTSNAGANTNLLAKNNARVLLGNVVFNVSGANVGVSQINGGFVSQQVGATFTNNATTPVLTPTVGTATGDLITPTISADATNVSGRISASTTTGGLAGGVTLTFSSAFAVAPKAITLTAFGAAQPTNLRVVSLSTTAAVLALTTPAGGGTAFSVSYLVAQ